MIPIYEDYRHAKQTVLARLSSQSEDWPLSMLDRIAEIFGQPFTPAQAVTHVLDDVQARRDVALQEWTSRIDGVNVTELMVPWDTIEDAYEHLDAELRTALHVAADRIREFHQRQPLPNWQTQDLGGTLGQRCVPMQRVGVYVPSGTAPLPSSLLMSVIPAQVAGVPEIVVCAPPDRLTGDIHPLVLAAAHIVGVTKVFRVGGAQAIAAMAYGTEQIPAVDKIVGPGGLFVTLAKQQLYGKVGIDGLFGPTETLVIADDSANPAWVAADLLAQAEHDVLATAVLLTPSATLAAAVQSAVNDQLSERQRGNILAHSLANQSGIVIVPDMDTAIELANDFAPEHLCLATHDPGALVDRIVNAGGIFVGERSFEVLGDYVAGPSHVMPTGGTARFASPLNVLDFVKIINIIALDAGTSAFLSPFAAQIAAAEGLDGHAQAAQFRADDPA